MAFFGISFISKDPFCKRFFLLIKVDTEGKNFILCSANNAKLTLNTKEANEAKDNVNLSDGGKSANLFSNFPPRYR